MITVNEIIKYSKPHAVQGGKVTRLSNDKVLISIVGGVSGLYGDFENDFEVAIFDKTTDEFITKFFRPDNNDDVIGYMSGKELEELVNQILHNGFQVS